jgi:hypothetical protein
MGYEYNEKMPIVSTPSIMHGALVGGCWFILAN